MQPIDAAEFLMLAAERGIGVDPAYAANWPRNIGFPSHAHRRFWTTGESFEELVATMSGVMAALAPESAVVLWPKSELWLAQALCPEDSNPVMRTILRDAAALKSHRGGFWFDRAEFDHLTSILTVTAALGWSWSDDLYVMPDRRDAIAMLDHHDVIWIEAATEARMEEIIRAMSAAGFELPTELPDQTFKPQDWIKPSPDAP